MVVCLQELLSTKCSHLPSTFIISFHRLGGPLFVLVRNLIISLSMCPPIHPFYRCLLWRFTSEGSQVEVTEGGRTGTLPRRAWLHHCFSASQGQIRTLDLEMGSLGWELHRSVCVWSWVGEAADFCVGAGGGDMWWKIPDGHSGSAPSPRSRRS